MITKGFAGYRAWSQLSQKPQLTRRLTLEATIDL